MDRSRWIRPVMTFLLLAGIGAALVVYMADMSAHAQSTAPLYPLLPTSTPAPVATRIPTPPAPPIPTATLSVYAPSCLASQLHMTSAFGGAAMGDSATRYTFVNVSSNACSLQGFPNARLLDSAGRPLAVKVAQTATAFMWSDAPTSKVELPPGGSAYFAIEVADVSNTGHSCVTAASTTIYPPHSASGFASSVNLRTCDGVISISPVVAQQSDL